MLPNISVVIPSYKSSKYIEATLESVVRQTYPREKLEVLVIDDASPDDSVAVARRFLAQHPLNGRVIAREKNAGAAATRNFGWRAASHDWIQFLDQDDMLAPHKVELQAKVAEEADPRVAVIYSNWQEFVQKDGQWQAWGPVNAPYVDDDPILRILEQIEFGYVGPTIIRKSILAQVGGFDEKPNLGEDCDLMLRIAMTGAKFREIHSPTPAFFYRQTPNSLWRTFIRNPVAMRNLVYGFRQVEEFLRRQRPDGNLPPQLRRALADRYSRFVDLYYLNDREVFRTLMGWLAGLGYRRPTGRNLRTRTLARLIGYENTLKLRMGLARLKGRITGQPPGEPA